MFIILVKKSNKKRKATSTPHLSIKNDSDSKRYRRTTNKNKSNGNDILFNYIYNLVYQSITPTIIYQEVINCYFIFIVFTRLLKL